MRRRPIVAAGLCAAAVLVGVASTLVVTMSSGSAATKFTVGQGVPLAQNALSSSDQEVLSAAVDGGVDQVSLLSRNGDHSFYRVTASDGTTCYAVGDGRSGLGLVGIACLHSSDPMPSALIDMSSVAIDPSDGSFVRLGQVEGIAADQVSTIAIERESGSQATASVEHNVYRFPAAALPKDPVAVVALDASGNVLERRSVR